MKKRLLALLLVLCMACTLLPVTALAATPADHQIQLKLVKDTTSFAGKELLRVDFEYKSGTDVPANQMVYLKYDAEKLAPIAVASGVDASAYATDFSINMSAAFTKSPYTLSNPILGDQLSEVMLYTIIKDGVGYICWKVTEPNGTSAFSDFTRISSIFFGLKGDTAFDAMPKDVIKLATPAEDKAVTAQTNSVEVVTKDDTIMKYNSETASENTLTVTPDSLFVAGDGVSFAKPTPTHTHVWATDWSHDATHHWHACIGEGACDGSVSDKAEHNYDKQVKSDAALKTAATCTHAAVYYKSCVCGAVSTNDADTFKDGDPKGHTYDQKVESDATRKSAATCTAPAEYYYSCVCGNISTTATFTSGSALGHEYTEQIKDEAHLKTKAANCQQKDTYWFDCSRCDANAKNDPAAADKFYESTTTGAHLFNKQVADEAYQVPGTGSNCQSKKQYYTRCYYCDAMDTTQIWTGAPGPHSIDNSTWKKDNTHHWNACTVPGCEAEFNPAGHQFKDGSTNCIACGFVCTHTNKTLVTGTPAACNVAGTKDYYQCNQCHAKFLHEDDTTTVPEKDLIIDALVHTGGTATCKKRAVCDLCKKEYGQLNPNNHAAGGEQVWVTDGIIASTQHEKAWNCCGKVTVPTENHEWDSTGKCTECNYQCKHNGGGTDATCIAKAKCGICGQEYGDLGSHNLTKTPAKAPTCTAEGNNAYWTCSVCHKVFKDAAGTQITSVEAEKRDMVPHTLTKTPAKAATCVATGNNDYWTCSVCKGVFKDADGKQTTTVAKETLSVDSSKHVGGTTLKHDDKQHWDECNSCHQPTAAKANHATTTEANKATCLKKAKCDTCDAEYGDLANHATTTEANKATCLKKAKCDTCGVEYGDLAKCANFMQAYNDKEHWQFCTLCGKVKDDSKKAHDLQQVAEENGGYTYCNDCDYKAGGKAPHQGDHTANTTKDRWERNDTHHWHRCDAETCTGHVDEAAHNYGTETKITEGNKTITIKTCLTCGYVLRTETTNTNPVTPGGNGGTGGGFPFKDNNKTNNTGKVESQKTFDGGIALYVGLSVLSLTGSALVIRKKKEF